MTWLSYFSCHYIISYFYPYLSRISIVEMANMITESFDTNKKCFKAPQPNQNKLNPFTECRI